MSIECDSLLIFKAHAMLGSVSGYMVHFCLQNVPFYHEKKDFLTKFTQVMLGYINM